MSDWAPVLILLAAMRANTEKVIEAIELSEEACSIGSSPFEE
jgi:hypothetical protein